jgi:hypothetical protein
LEVFDVETSVIPTEAKRSERSGGTCFPHAALQSWPASEPLL